MKRKMLVIIALVFTFAAGMVISVAAYEEEDPCGHNGAKACRGIDCPIVKWHERYESSTDTWMCCDQHGLYTGGICDLPAY